MDRSVVVEVGVPRASASVASYFWPGPGRAWGLWAGSDGARVLAVEERDGPRRVVRRYSDTPEGLRALDETVFRVDAAGFAEVERRRRAGEPNRIRAPFALPATLSLGQRVAVGGGEVRVGWIGRCRLGEQEVDGLRLDAEAAGKAGTMWLARGLGELALGGRARLVGWEDERGGRFGPPLGAAWTGRELPPLPPWDGRDAPEQGLL